MLHVADPGNKHQEEADVVQIDAAVAESKLTVDPLPTVEEAIKDDDKGVVEEEEEEKSTTDQCRRHSSIDVHSFNLFVARRCPAANFQALQKNSLDSPHPVKNCQVRITDNRNGVQTTCTLLSMEMPRLIEANHHSA